MSEASPQGDEGRGRLVAWGQARPRRRALEVSGEAATPLTVTVGGVTRSVRFVAGDMEALPFASGTFDLVTCHLAAHRFAHAAIVVREVQRVLTAGGSFLIAEPLARDETDAAPSRTYRRPEWHAFLRAAGLTVMDEDVIAAAGSDRVILLRAEKD